MILHTEKQLPVTRKSTDALRIGSGWAGGKRYIGQLACCLCVCFVTLAHAQGYDARTADYLRAWRIGAAGATPSFSKWTPLDIESATVHAFYWHLSAMTIEDDKVSVWHDASGNERHLIQNDSSGQPDIVYTNDVANLRFDGIGDSMVYSAGGEVLSQPLAVYSSFYLPTTPTQNADIIGGEPDGIQIRPDWSGVSNDSLWFAGGTDMRSLKLGSGGWVFGLSMNGTQSRYRSQGGGDFRTGFPGSNPLRSFSVAEGAQYLDAYIGFILIISGVLSIDEVYKVEGFAYHTYGHGSLPPSHPYYKDAPTKELPLLNPDIYDAGGYRYYVFTNTLTGIWSSPVSTDASIFVVGGGGSGQGPIQYSGGGGAGGVVLTNDTLSVNTDYVVSVGHGGWQSLRYSLRPSYGGSDGDSSRFGEYLALGGGAGKQDSGMNGGSGGGGGNVGDRLGGIAIDGQGNNGGMGSDDSPTDRAGGGGGGYSSMGSNASGSTGGNGGAGIDMTSWLNGLSLGDAGWFAGGGGGSSRASTGRGIGGQGGGGDGARWSTGLDSTPGTPSTGGGGGAGTHNREASMGGSGIVIVRHEI